MQKSAASHRQVRWLRIKHRAATLLPVSIFFRGVRFRFQCYNISFQLVLPCSRGLWSGLFLWRRGGELWAFPP